MNLENALYYITEIFLTYYYKVPVIEMRFYYVSMVTVS